MSSDVVGEVIKYLKKLCEYQPAFETKWRRRCTVESVYCKVFNLLDEFIDIYKPCDYVKERLIELRWAVEFLGAVNDKETYKRLQREIQLLSEEILVALGYLT